MRPVVLAFLLLFLAPVQQAGASESWGIYAIHSRQAWRYGVGMGVVVAVLDTCIADVGTLTGHLLPAVDVSPLAPDATKCNHGTEVASIIVDNAPGVTILPVRVWADGTTVDFSFLPTAIRAAIRNQVQIINISGGGTYQSEALQSAIEEAQQAGIIVVASSGNSGQTVRFWPASYPTVISVAASNRNDQLSLWSGFLDGVSVSAPGEFIDVLRADGSVGLVSGTSFSAPHVTAVVALVLSSRPTMSIAETKSSIVGTVSGQARRIDALLAVERAVGMRHRLSMVSFGG